MLCVYVMQQSTLGDLFYKLPPVGISITAIRNNESLLYCEEGALAIECVCVSHSTATHQGL